MNKQQAEIISNFALKKNENYIPQVFFKKCKYMKKRVTRLIADDVESCSDSDKSDEK